MRIFDACLDAPARPDGDLANLGWFGAEAAVIASAPDRSLETAEDLLCFFDELLAVHAARASAAGIRALVALGVRPERLPRRTFDEVWDRLPSLLLRDEVAAVGVLDGSTPGGEALMVRQLEFAASAGVPALVSVAGSASRRCAERVIAAAHEVRLPIERLALLRCDYTSIRLALDEGARVIVSTGPVGTDPADAASMLHRYGRVTASATMLATGFSGPAFDVLGIARACEALESIGADPSDVRRMAYDNAVAFFGGDSPETGRT